MEKGNNEEEIKIANQLGVATDALLKLIEQLLGKKALIVWGAMKEDETKIYTTWVKSESLLPSDAEHLMFGLTGEIYNTINYDTTDITQKD